MAERFIWVTRWEEFQHYRPQRDRGPAWVKAYTAQLDDDRYLCLTGPQRALLHDLRFMFASMRSRCRYDVGSISARRRERTTNHMLEALNHAGFIEVISRETLELRLEQLYSRSRVRERTTRAVPVASTPAQGEPEPEPDLGLGDAPQRNGTAQVEDLNQRTEGILKVIP